MNNLKWNSFLEFKHEVMYSNRYFYSDESKRLIEFISNTFEYRVKVLVKGTEIYRSQIGCKRYYGDETTYLDGFEEDRMKPLSTKVCDGRANSKGISVLYLSSDEITSMSELRPPVGAIISCATFVINNDVRIINCHSDTNIYNHGQLIFGEPKTADEWMDRIWYEINRSFSQPVSNNINSAEYVPTQILTELIRSKGFDGLCCKSHLGPGLNYILFNPHTVNMKNCILKEAERVEYTFKEFDENENLFFGNSDFYVE